MNCTSIDENFRPYNSIRTSATVVLCHRPFVFYPSVLRAISKISLGQELSFNYIHKAYCCTSLVLLGATCSSNTYQKQERQQRLSVFVTRLSHTNTLLATSGLGDRLSTSRTTAVCIHPTRMHINQTVYNTGIQLLSKQWDNCMGPCPEELGEILFNH